jgi:hypothetical protein
MVKKLVFLVIILLIVSCKDDKIEIVKETYSGTDLRLDGYYFNVVGDGRDILIFYRNGVMLSSINFSKDLTFEGIEKELTSDKFIVLLKKDKIFWSNFRISNKAIKYETWEPTLSKDYLFTNSGIIMNDTTFVMSKLITSKNKELIRNDTFRFKYLFEKPDSTNRFL